MANQKPFYLVSSEDVYGVDDFGQGEDFWNHHGNTKEDYMSLAENLPEVNERISNGESLESLRNDPDLGACASAYYGQDKMIKVNATEDGYEFDSDGRHRMRAAQEMGYEVPVDVQNPEVMDSPPRYCNLYDKNQGEGFNANSNQQENATDLIDPDNNQPQNYYQEQENSESQYNGYSY